MRRREFLYLAAAASAGTGAQAHSPLGMGQDKKGWRVFEITTRVRVLHPSGVTRVWLPEPLAEETPFQKLLASRVDVGGRYLQQGEETAGMVAAVFPGGVEPVLVQRVRVATRDWDVPLGSSGRERQRGDGDLQGFLTPTRYVPTDGIVKRKAEEITAGAATDVQKARAIYEWIVENTHREAKVRGCGVGDIRPMLETGNLGGKCADLNALFVGLARAAGLPARDVYGLRVGPSRLEARSLGTKSEDVSKAQHCRAEVYLNGPGWVPVDPADVRKVVLEESPGNLTLTDEKVQDVRARLFGSWEMNWVAFNYRQDVTLPGSDGPPLHFFMYPQAETAEGRLDSLDPDSFQYEITSHEVTSTVG